MTPERAAIFDLSLAEKLQLVEELWNDIASTPDQVPIPEWHKAVLDRRQAQLDRDPSAVLTWEETLKRIKRRDAR